MDAALQASFPSHRTSQSMPAGHAIASPLQVPVPVQSMVHVLPMQPPVQTFEQTAPTGARLSPQARQAPSLNWQAMLHWRVPPAANPRPSQVWPARSFMSQSSLPSAMPSPHTAPVVVLVLPPPEVEPETPVVLVLPPLEVEPDTPEVLPSVVVAVVVAVTPEVLPSVAVVVAPEVLPESVADAPDEPLEPLADVPPSVPTVVSVSLELVVGSVLDVSVVDVAVSVPPEVPVELPSTGGSPHPVHAINAT